MGETMDEADVIGFCKEKMAGYKCPKLVGFLESLPKNSTGKISKVDLRILEKSKDKERGGH
jgi:fatty-acyl-CoA synthase